MHTVEFLALFYFLTFCDKMNLHRIFALPFNENNWMGALVALSLAKYQQIWFLFFIYGNYVQIQMNARKKGQTFCSTMPVSDCILVWLWKQATDSKCLLLVAYCKNFAKLVSQQIGVIFHSYLSLRGVSFAKDDGED